MRKTTAFLILIALVLAACSTTELTPQATSEPASPTAPEAEPTQEQTEPTQVQATAAQALPTQTQAEPTPTRAQPEPTIDYSGAQPVDDPTSEPALPESGAAVFKIIPEESTLTYEVGETFINMDNAFNVAIGLTGIITGEVTLDPENPQNSQISPLTADISQFKSDSSRRDQALRDRFLESARYPLVTFVPTAIQGLPESYSPGETLTFTVAGDLTIRDTTRPATFEVTARLEGNELTGEATTTFLMSDFGFGPISIAGILGTEDEVKMKLSFLARP